jgi:hypothetical protein
VIDRAFTATSARGGKRHVDAKRDATGFDTGPVTILKPHRIMKLIFIIVSGLLACARAASAQTHQEQGVFIQGGALAAIERRSHSDIDSTDALALVVAPDDGGSSAPAGTIGAGVFLRPFLSARADVVFTGEFEQENPIAIPAGLVFPTDAVIRPISQSRTRSAEVHALLAYHLPTERRFRLALLAGVSFARQRTRFNSDFFIATVPGLPGVTRSAPTRQIEYSFVSYRRDLVIGVDGEFALGEKFALIPDLRVIGGSGSISIRPGVTVRWRP